MPEGPWLEEGTVRDVARNHHESDARSDPSPARLRGAGRRAAPRRAVWPWRFRSARLHSVPGQCRAVPAAPRSPRRSPRPLPILPAPRRDDHTPSPALPNPHHGQLLAAVPVRRGETALPPRRRPRDRHRVRTGPGWPLVEPRTALRSWRPAGPQLPRRKVKLKATGFSSLSPPGQIPSAFGRRIPVEGVAGP
jgi:hypothetical protein